MFLTWLNSLLLHLVTLAPGTVVPEHGKSIQLTSVHFAANTDIPALSPKCSASKSSKRRSELPSICSNNAGTCPR